MVVVPAGWWCGMEGKGNREKGKGMVTSRRQCAAHQALRINPILPPLGSTRQRSPFSLFPFPFCLIPFSLIPFSLFPAFTINLNKPIFPAGWQGGGKGGMVECRLWFCPCNGSALRSFGICRGGTRPKSLPLWGRWQPEGLTEEVPRHPYIFPFIPAKLTRCTI